MANRKKCGFSHSFEHFGLVSFKNNDSFISFDVEICRKCGLSEFFAVRSGRIEQPPPKNEDWDNAIG